MKLIDKLKEELDRLEEIGQLINISDGTITSSIINILYNHYQGNLFKIVMEIDNSAKEKAKEKELILYKGVEDGMHNFSSLAHHILEDTNIRKARRFAKFFLEEDNIAMTINIMKAYFPGGTCKGASTNGQWFFNKFKEMLTKNKDKYLEGGNSYDWACNYKHIDYIRKLLKEENVQE